MDLIVRLDWYVPMNAAPFYREQMFMPWMEDDMFGWMPLTFGLVC